MTLSDIVEAIRAFPGITRKHTIHEIVRFLPTTSFANVAASEGEDAAAIEFGDDYILFAADGIMESLLKTNPFYAGYFAVLVNVNDIAAMGGRALAMVDVMSMKNDKTCSQILKGMERAVRKFNVPIVGGHTHPDCEYHAIDISIIGSVPKTDIILSSTAKPDDDIVFVMDTDGFYPPDLRYAWDTTTNKDDKLVQDQMDAMCTVASEHLAHAAKDMSNPGCIGTMGMLLESSGKGGYIDVDALIFSLNIVYCIRICTMRSAVRPSQRSGRAQCFHSPFTIHDTSSARRCGSSPTSTFEPTLTVS